LENHEGHEGHQESDSKVLRLFLVFSFVYFGKTGFPLNSYPSSFGASEKSARQ